MRKSVKLIVLVGVLLVICVAAFAVSHYEQKKEQIKSSGEIILEIPTETVTALAWTNEQGSYSFTRGDVWTYDADTAFPVDEDKISELLSPFVSFAAAFTIEDVEDFSQYGLNNPLCTVSFTADGKEYTVSIGDYSKMDQQRYLSLSDNTVYLTDHDLMDEFDAVVEDLILNDTVPSFDTADKIVFSGSVNETVIRDEEGTSICEDDVYFSDGRPLDTDNVNDFLSTLKKMSLTDFVSYNVSADELTTFGLDNPSLIATVDYSVVDSDGNVESTDTLTVNLSRNTEELAAYNTAVENGDSSLPDVTCYLRLGESQIVYEISESVYKVLTAVSYNDLRHEDLFSGDFSTVTAMDVSLGGESFTFTYAVPEAEAGDGAEATDTATESSSDEEQEKVWTYQGAEFDMESIEKALCAITASSFTEDAALGEVEISVTLHLDNESFPTFTLTLYRYDGSNCVAAVDGETVAFVDRSAVVDLVEAVHTVTLGSTAS